EKGEPKGVSLAPDGTLRLSPKLDTLFEARQPYVWALAQDSGGNLFASSGNDGAIYRITPSGKGEVFFRAAEPEVHALAVDGGGNVYAGTAPGGRIYKIAPDGRQAWTQPSGESYVWALVLDAQGNLFAGTGVGRGGGAGAPRPPPPHVGGRRRRGSVAGGRGAGCRGPGRHRPEVPDQHGRETPDDLARRLRARDLVGDPGGGPEPRLLGAGSAASGVERPGEALYPRGGRHRRRDRPHFVEPGDSAIAPGGGQGR